MLLAAGFGQRMVPLTLRRAKPTLPFLNRSLLLRQLDYLERARIDEVVVNTHHRPESIRDLLRQASLGPAPENGPFTCGRLTVHLSREENRLGTAGGLRHAAHHFRSSGTFLCLNSDIVSEIDLSAAVRAHREGGQLATLVLAPPVDGYTPVAYRQGRMVAFGRAAAAGTGVPVNWGTFTGIHVLEPAVLERLPDGPSGFLPALYLPMLAAGEPLGAHLGSGSWVEVGTARRYLDTQVQAVKGKILLAPGCRVAAEARLEQGCILGRRVTVGPGARLTRVVLLDRVSIGENARIRDSIVGPGTSIPPGERVSRCLVEEDRRVPF
ncbi:MAG: sugar phosphate nucleotidyltransferase [Acidobacteriota bacterium]